MRLSTKRILPLILCALILLYSVSNSVALSESYNLEYDSNGNLVQDTDKYYEYNSLNQLIKVRENNENGRVLEEYSYDHNGDRIKKITYNENSSQKTTYYIDDNFIREVNSSGNYDTKYYYHNGQLIAREENNGDKYYYHLDHLGSTNVVTDQNGDVVEETSYLPFGEILEGGESKFTFTGKEADSTGIMYFGARYYSPFLRKFTQPDTVIQDVYDPQSLNRYSYARNNPVKYVDETGNWWHIPIGAAVGALIGGTVSAIYQYRRTRRIVWRDVGKSAGAGAVFGGVAAATFGIGLAAGAGYGGYALGGAISGFTGGRASQLTTNLMYDDRSWNQDLLNGKDIAIETGGGAVFGVAGKAVSAFKGSLFKNTPKPNLNSGKIQKFPLKDIYGTHSLDKKSILTPQKITEGMTKGPAQIYNYDGRLIINDGMGRGGRYALRTGENAIPGRIMNPDPNDIKGWEYARDLWYNNGKPKYNMQGLVNKMRQK